jgi:hypothetical protein
MGKGGLQPAVGEGQFSRLPLDAFQPKSYVDLTLIFLKPLTLEQAINFIREDELVEITPLSLRMRKAVLSASKRHTLRNKKAKA